MKSGYPPKALTLIPELPLSSLGLQRGEQLIVTSKPGIPQPSPTISAPAARPQPVASAPTPALNVGKSADGFVETEAGTLVHRVGLSL